MVFTPPPSPLAPRHSIPISPIDDDSDDSSSQYLTVPSFHDPSVRQSQQPPPPDMLFVAKPKPLIPSPATSSSSSSSSSPLLATQTRRRLLVFLVPAILLLIGSTTRFIHNHGAPVNQILMAAKYTPMGDASLFAVLQHRDADIPSPPFSIPHSGSALDSLSHHLRSVRRYNGFSSTPAKRGVLDDVVLDAQIEHRSTSASPTTSHIVVDPTSTDHPSPTVPENVAQQTAPAIPAVPWPVPTPCAFPSFPRYSFACETRA